MKDINKTFSWSKVAMCITLTTGLFVGNAYSQTTKESNKTTKSKETDSEIVMSVEELESLLSKIAEKRRQANLNKQSDLGYNSASLVSGIRMQPTNDLALLNQKMDLLLQLYRINPVQQPGQTVVVTPNTLTTNPSNSVSPATNSIVATGNKSPEGRNILRSQAIYFANNSTKLNAQDQATILKFAQDIQANSSQTMVVLRGFASKTGSAFYNNQLSFNRAEAIKKVLVGSGVRADQIMILYHGADSSIPDNMARRVDINLEQL